MESFLKVFAKNRNWIWDFEKCEKPPSLAEGVGGGYFCVAKSLNLKNAWILGEFKGKNKVTNLLNAVAHERNSKLKFRSLIAFSLQFLFRATHSQLQAETLCFYWILACRHFQGLRLEYPPPKPLSAPSGLRVRSTKQKWGGFLRALNSPKICHTERSEVSQGLRFFAVAQNDN